MSSLVAIDFSTDAYLPVSIGDEMPFLFSYGTLQHEDVQRSTFGRTLSGRGDELPDWRPSFVKIDDEATVRALGRTHHANVTFSGRGGESVRGTVFEITEAELACADEFEAAFSYKRIAVTLASGTPAWVYVHDASSFGCG